jgi:hypothetical protein
MSQRIRGFGGHTAWRRRRLVFFSSELEREETARRLAITSLARFFGFARFTRYVGVVGCLPRSGLRRRWARGRLDTGGCHVRIVTFAFRILGARPGGGALGGRILRWVVRIARIAILGHGELQILKGAKKRRNPKNKIK